MSVNRSPDYSEHGTKEVDMFCAQRLHDILMDAQPRKIRNSEFG